LASSGGFQCVSMAATSVSGTRIVPSLLSCRFTASSSAARWPEFCATRQSIETSCAVCSETDQRPVPTPTLSRLTITLWDGALRRPWSMSWRARSGSFNRMVP